MSIKQRVGQKIRELRLQAGYSQEQLASKTGLHRTYISDVERGERNISIENIGKIAKALGVQAYELFL